MGRLGEAAYHPDVVVVCPGRAAPDRLFERDLSLVVEVLSASTTRAGWPTVVLSGR